MGSVYLKFCLFTKFIIILMMIDTIAYGYSTGMSYSKFSGPVAGPEKKIIVTDKDGHLPTKTFDYVSKPDYHFAYGVKDPKSRVLQSRQETRVGDNVKGEYSVLDPDGKFRTVKYTADKHNGFHARIFSDGHEYAFYPPPLPVPENPPATNPPATYDESDDEGENNEGDEDEEGTNDEEESEDEGDDEEDDEEGDDEDHDNTDDEYEEETGDYYQ